MLVSPHLTVYDLVILAPAFLLLGDWALAHRDYSRLGFSIAICMLPVILAGAAVTDNPPAAFRRGNDGVVVDELANLPKSPRALPS